MSSHRHHSGSLKLDGRSTFGLVKRFVPICAILVFGAGCGEVTCGGASPDFSAPPLVAGRIVAAGPPQSSTELFYPIAVPSAEVGTVVSVAIEDDPEGAYKKQCQVIRAVGKQAVLWYCQSSVRFTGDDFGGGKHIELPGGFRATLLPCEPTNLAWNKGDVSYSVHGDPTAYTGDEVISIARTLAGEDTNPSAPKVGTVVTSATSNTSTTP